MAPRRKVGGSGSIGKMENKRLGLEKKGVE